jgi:hypothetical protein
VESAGGSREVHPEVSEHGLKEDAIGFRDALIISIASTAPAYSLAAVIGLVVVTVGVQAPAVLLASFIPMLFVATAFYYMNRADQDCGTTSRVPKNGLSCPWTPSLSGSSLRAVRRPQPRARRTAHEQRTLPQPSRHAAGGVKR